MKLIAVASGLLALTAWQAAGTSLGLERAVPLYVTVTGPGAETVPALSREDFLILDDGQQREVLSLSGGDAPVALSVVLDLSGDMFAEATRLIQSVQTLLGAMPVDGRPGMILTLRSRRDAANWRAMESSTRPSLIQAVTRLRMRFEFGYPLWRACEWAMEAVAFRQARRVLVVVTDGPAKGDRARLVRSFSDPAGGDTLRKPTDRELLEYVDREDVLVYAIGFDGSKFDDLVKRLAVRSGGRVITLARNGDLSVIFRQIADEVSGQYVLRFEPTTLDGKTHALEVQVKRDNLNVRSRQQYTAFPRPVEDQD